MKVNKTYDFELVFTLPMDKRDPEDHLDSLYEAGCDDALVGLGRHGVIGLDFTRSGKTIRDAIGSAISDVLAAIPGARLQEAGPDLTRIIHKCCGLEVSEETLSGKHPYAS